MLHLTDLNRYQAALTIAEQRGASGMYARTSALLTFESSVESEYRADRRLASPQVLRFGLPLSVIFYAAFFIIDGLFWGRYQFWWAMLPILYISSGVNLALVAATWSTWLRPHLVPLATAVVLINAFAFSAASAYGATLGVMMPPEAPVIQQVYALFLLNLPFRLAAPVTLLNTCVFVLLHLLTGMDSGDLFYRCFMMAAAGMVGALACYFTEHTHRLAWLRSQLLRELSEHDSLTGLYNHRLFYERADQLLRQSQRDRCGVAVLACDLDYFKRYNDTYGHLAGDEALRQVAAALAQCARRPLDLVARLGGEEFGLLLYNITPAAALQVAEQVRQIVRQLDLSAGRRVTISIGVAHAESGTATTVETLVGTADSALYRAKDAGRDHICS